MPLGSGGHGAVWEAEDRLSGDLVAVKLLNAGLSGHPARVRREIAALRLLRLPGVVRLLDEGLDRGRAFLVMERVAGLPFPGTSARTRPWSELAGTTVALLETLARVHATGVIHRDLKPGNVLVTADGRPMLLDFGIVHFESRARDALTLRNEVMGTPAYLAPEQINGDPVTARTDLYALGVMLYEALSGQLPHAADNVWTLLQARLTQAVPPLAGVAPDVPAGVAHVIDALLHERAADRPRSAAAVLSMLQGAPEGRRARAAALRSGRAAAGDRRRRAPRRLCRRPGAPGLGAVALPRRRRGEARAKVPSPLLRSTLTVSSSRLATARSSLPSPSRSAATTDWGDAPTRAGGGPGSPTMAHAAAQTPAEVQLWCAGQEPGAPGGRFAQTLPPAQD